MDTTQLFVLPQKIVKKIIDLKLVNIAELITDHQPLTGTGDESLESQWRFEVQSCWNMAGSQACCFVLLLCSK